MKADLWISCTKATGLVTVDENGLILKTPPIWRRFIGSRIIMLDEWLRKKFGEVTILDITVKDDNERS